MKNFFDSTEKYENYIKEYQFLYAIRIKLTSFLILFLSFLGYFLAYFSYKQYFFNISIILIGWQVVITLILLLTYNKRIISNHTYAIILKYLIVISTVLSICLMIYITGGAISPYYAGLNLVIIGSAPMFLYTMKETIKECSIIILCYIITVLIPNNISFNLGIFFNNLYFMVLFSIGSIVIAYESTKIRITEFNQRYALKENQKDLEKALSKVEDSLAQIKSMQVKLMQDDKIKTLGIVTASIVHEINSPLNSVKLGTRFLKEDLEDYPEFKEIIDGVCEGVERIERVGADLRKFASGGNKLVEMFELSEVLKSALIYASNKVNGIKIEGNFEERIYVEGYPGEVLQVFLNLIINAADALNETDKTDKEIKINWSEEKEKILIKIKDNGPGIEEEKIKNLFTPFYTTKTAGTGMGLGLSICANIVKNHKSQLKVKSKVGEFTEFSFELPINK